MVKRNVLIRKVEQIERHLAKLKIYQELSCAAFLDHADAQDIITFNLFQAVNNLISMIEHVVVDEGYGLPESASHAAEILVRQKILTARDLQIMCQMAGFRNIIALQYADIDQKKVHAALRCAGKDIRGIVKKLTKRFKL